MKNPQKPNNQNQPPTPPTICKSCAIETLTQPKSNLVKPYNIAKVLEEESLPHRNVKKTQKPNNQNQPPMPPTICKSCALATLTQPSKNLEGACNIVIVYEEGNHPHPNVNRHPPQVRRRPSTSTWSGPPPRVKLPPCGDTRVAPQPRHKAQIVPLRVSKPCAAPRPPCIYGNRPGRPALTLSSPTLPDPLSGIAAKVRHALTQALTEGTFTMTRPGQHQSTPNTLPVMTLRPPSAGALKNSAGSPS